MTSESQPELSFSIVSGSESPPWFAQVADWLGPGGLLQRAEPGFRPRAGQMRLAQAVAQCVAEGGVLVAEAGTGVGKTYGYLLPALLSGRRTLIATATRNLQDQLSTRDLPRLLALLGVNRRVAPLKGRASYLCTHRLASARRDGHYLGDAELRHLAQVERWAHSTRSGDLAELPELDETSPLLPLITSTRDNCLGARCAGWQACHVNEARRRAMLADVVVINHHLFFADLQLRESGVAELLPSVQTVVFDEAHRLNDIGVQFMGRQFSTRQLRGLATELVNEGMRWARGFQPWPELASLLEQQARALDQCLGRDTPRAGVRLRWLGASPEGVAAGLWQQNQLQLAAVLARVLEALQVVAETAPELRRLAERVDALQQSWAGFMRPPSGRVVRWLELGRQARCMEAPLNIAEAIAPLIVQDTQAGVRSWVFTSATLGLDESLSWFTEPAGLQGHATVLRVASPFDYRQQACLHVPEGLPDAQDPDHACALAHWLVEPLRCLGGRTLVLATSLRALGELAQQLQHLLAGSGIDVLVQGQGSRRRLLERFRQGGGAGRPCVLLASGAFWEGVDVPGDALQMLVIDKLPFPVPDDPLVQARSQALRQQGLSPFEAYVLPETAMALKQGAGRLIRSETDRGVLVIADERLLQRSYGPQLLAALPDMPVLYGQPALMQALGALRQAG